MSEGYQITASATDPNGNTSEFSVCAAVAQSTPTNFSYNWQYEYDPLYRLTYACSDWDDVGEVCNGDEYSYTYDAVGNRLTETTQYGTTTYTYDTANRMTSEGAPTPGTPTATCSVTGSVLMNTTAPTA